MTEQFVVGIIRGSHGITGEFKVESTSGEYEHFASMKEVTLRYGESEKVCKVEYTKEASDYLYMKLEEVNSPEEAAKLNRWEIVVPRKYAHPLKENEWYIEDLKGCSVFYKEAAETETVIGTVTNVLEGGSGYLVEILLSESCSLLEDHIKLNKKGKAKTVYVPFKDQFIGQVDVENEKIQLMHLWILE
ncbi:MAG: ribosome maturation factor RimM [Treponema sp.]|nr:ribosome maturation factor RimM [Spirochaetia bacterium]MDD7014877.1 ribosome maturation factor RimM [Spirochaetales bacterium]MDY4901720.1 ribosome maturation factor RimM [Treponema sp.]